jgi:hypothetical protein
MNKSSVFVAYAALCVAGFAGIALLGVTGKSDDVHAITAFFAFYGFLCTTGLFYVIGKQKVAIDMLITRIENVNDVVYNVSEQNNVDAVRCVDELRLEMNRRLDGLENFELSNIWRSIEDLQNADADAKFGSKK